MIKKRNDLSSNQGFLMVMGVPFPWFSIAKRNDGKTLDIVIRIFRHSSSNSGPKTWSVERIQGGGLKNDARCTRCLSKIWMIYWLIGNVCTGFGMIYWLVVWNNHPNRLMMIYLEWYRVLQKNIQPSYEVQDHRRHGAPRPPIQCCTLNYIFGGLQKKAISVHGVRHFQAQHWSWGLRV